MAMTPCTSSPEPPVRYGQPQRAPSSLIKAKSIRLKCGSTAGPAAKPEHGGHDGKDLEIGGHGNRPLRVPERIAIPSIGTFEVAKGLRAPRDRRRRLPASGRSAALNLLGSVRPEMNSFAPPP